jgi:hypothetical protein
MPLSFPSVLITTPLLSVNNWTNLWHLCYFHFSRGNTLVSPCAVFLLRFVVVVVVVVVVVAFVVIVLGMGILAQHGHCFIRYFLYLHFKYYLLS